MCAHLYGKRVRIEVRELKCLKGMGMENRGKWAALLTALGLGAGGYGLYKASCQECAVPEPIVEKPIEADIGVPEPTPVVEIKPCEPEVIETVKFVEVPVIMPTPTPVVKWKTKVVEKIVYRDKVYKRGCTVDWVNKTAYAKGADNEGVRCTVDWKRRHVTEEVMVYEKGKQKWVPLRRD